jgi:hypothetical protein
LTDIRIHFDVSGRGIILTVCSITRTVTRHDDFGTSSSGIFHQYDPWNAQIFYSVAIDFMALSAAEHGLRPMKKLQNKTKKAAGLKHLRPGQSPSAQLSDWVFVK